MVTDLGRLWGGRRRKGWVGRGRIVISEQGDNLTNYIKQVLWHPGHRVAGKSVIWSGGSEKVAVGTSIGHG